MKFSALRSVARFFLAGLLLLAAGCVSTERVDRDVYREVMQSTRNDAMISTNAALAARDVIETLPPALTQSALTLDRDEALRLAARFSRDLQDKRDKLYADALTLFAARREFEVQYSGTAEYVLNSDRNGDTSRQASLSVGAKRVLPTGATIRFTGAGAQAEARGTNSYTSSTGVQIEQPLGAGAGFEASHGPLIDAEHNYIYALRAFSLERQDFAIGIIRDFYDLVQQKSVVSNLTLTHAEFAYLRLRSEALFSVSRAPAIDVMRAQQQELSATNQLTTSEESYQIQKAGFLVQLGLPVSQQATVSVQIPSMHSVPGDSRRALELALARRPDVQTVRDRIGDAERELRIARNLYEPEVNLFGKGDVTGGGEFKSQDYVNTASAGISAEIPFERRGRREAVKLAALKLDASRRAWQQKQDEVALEVASSYSQLRSLANSVEIQTKNKEIAEKRAENASFRFKEGELSNREIVEAQTELLNARNGYVAALLSYEVQRLKLLRNIGLLDVGPDGDVIELKP